ncbi:NAD(P)/FAD-dependent oxidoreductase [Histidinibacterium aquaticum]|uniref:FAD-binding oxidoreductase n=1 Tax=Histidinibacterium aquaticum TaxID=2613962 RepID=A0A5J5GMJ2_9RHOB|nr:FAD-binding oxidoreductase [Histidinibacterium aquaticum]KAA9008818.1 FAD-binding oxidoreductase [Histidinibacterium aquaticum]
MRYDLAVIGGGLAGTATAYYAARAGARVVLLERHDVNLGASGSNAGSIHAQIPFDPFRRLGADWARHYSEVLPLFIESIGLWGRLQDELGGDLGFVAKGGLMVAGTEAEMDMLREKSAIERAQGLQVDLWDQGDLSERAPFLTEGFPGGAFCPIEGKADPFRVAPLFLRRAREAGAKLLRNAPVKAIDVEAGGFAIAAGDRTVHASRVVNAAGAQAAEVAALLGVTVPLDAHPIQVSVTEKRPPLLSWLLYFTSEKLTLKQAPEGGFLIGGGWPARMRGGPVVDHRSVLRNLALAQRLVPGLADVQIVRSWAAIVNGTKDWRPILGEVPQVPGFFLNLFPWMGFTAGPAVSRAIASLALGERPDVDLAPFAP